MSNVNSDSSASDSNSRPSPDGVSEEQAADIARLKLLINKAAHVQLPTVRSGRYYIRKERCVHVCPVSGEEIPPQYLITMISNDKAIAYDVSYLLPCLEADRLLRDPMTRIPYSFAELQRVRQVAARAGISVASDAVLQAEHEMRKLWEHVLTVANYQNLTCYPDMQRQLSDINAFLRNQTEDAKPYPEQDRIQIARMRSDSAERHWRQRIAEMLEPSLQHLNPAFRAAAAAAAAAPPDALHMLVNQLMAGPRLAARERRRVAYFAPR